MGNTFSVSPLAQERYGGRMSRLLEIFKILVEICPRQVFFSLTMGPANIVDCVRDTEQEYRILLPEEC